MPQVIPPIEGFKFVMYFNDHIPPHVHIKKDDFEVKIDISGDKAILVRGEEHSRTAADIKYRRKALTLTNRNLNRLKAEWEALQQQ